MTSGSHADQLLAIAERAANCTNCALAETRRNVVFGEGNPGMRRSFSSVRALATAEDATGRPFVGARGHLARRVHARLRDHA